MTRPRTQDWTRRATLGGLAAGAGAGIAGFGWESAAAEPPPEVTTLKLLNDPANLVLCWAPQYLANEFLRQEGFTDIQLVPRLGGRSDTEKLADGRIDLTAKILWDMIASVDEGLPITMLGGLHTGCFEVFASDRVDGISDLRGARIVTRGPRALDQSFLVCVLAYVGLDPSRDVTWVHEPDFSLWPELFARGDADIAGAFTALNYRFRELGFGHVILNTTLDDPWRHFFCCVFAANREFASRYPVATKRALRAIAKAQALCRADPEGSARRLVELGATDRLDFALRALQDIPYGDWHAFDPAASIRFYALRMREAGLITSSPNEIVARGTDFSFHDELRREMKS